MSRLATLLIKQYKQMRELSDEFFQIPKPSELERAIFNLKTMELSVIPYSAQWNLGHKKALRMAIKALEAQLPKNP